MRIDKVLTPKSSFLSVEKDMGIIITELLKNERLKRLLYHTTPQAMTMPNNAMSNSDNSNHINSKFPNPCQDHVMKVKNDIWNSSFLIICKNANKTKHNWNRNHII